MKVSCNKVGGPAVCPYVAEGNSPEEIIGKISEHGMTTHPEVKAQMEKMTEEEKKQWTEMVKTKIEE